MEMVVKAAIIYMVLLVTLRLSGRRTLSETTPFDLVLLLVISEAAQQGLLGNDYSLTSAIVAIITLVLIDIGLAMAKNRSPLVDRIIDGVPTVLVENGQLLQERMKKARVSYEDIMESARQLQGLERLDQIKFAVLEVGGHITIIPAEKS